jgi:hypothetical protein
MIEPSLTVGPGHRSATRLADHICRITISTGTLTLGAAITAFNAAPLICDLDRRKNLATFPNR